MFAVIAAGGKRPDRKEFSEYAKKCDMLIAADSGADWLFRFGIAPDVLLGDFDSASKTAITTFKMRGAKMITVNPEKDITDTMLAARYAEDHGAEKVVIFGGMGDRLDHVYGNFQVMSYLKSKGIESLMIDEHCIVQIASGKAEVVAPAGSVVSVLPFGGDITVTADEGSFKYPMKELRLKTDLPDPVGVSNVLNRTKAHLKITGTALIFINR